MVNHQMRLISISAPIALNKTMFFKAFHITKNRIFYLCSRNTVNYSSTFTRTILSFSTLICFSACYYFSTNLARFSLITRQRAINCVFASCKSTYFECITASRANFFFIGSLVRATTRTVNLPIPATSIVALELCLTDRASIHGDYYATT